MIYRRDLEQIISNYAKLPVVALLGPRQSGKTTLAKHVFKKHTYISFENPDDRQFATEDPQRFLALHENEHGLILDEFQLVPAITSYIMLEVDQRHRPGYFVLTGSQNFLVNQAITQSLAGRVGILTLPPLTLHELKENNLLHGTVDELMLKGSYPRVYQEAILPEVFYPSYIQSYIEKDIRQLINVTNLSLFQRFVQLCAGRSGQVLNLSSLASDCGISFHTARQWLSLLEASYLVFLLQPHHKNFNRRITKSPKLYFLDTGVACSLMRITTLDQLAIHPLRRYIFETFVIADLYKQFVNVGKPVSLYYWRDQKGTHEVDCIVDTGTLLIPIEIKSGETIHSTYFKELSYWKELSGTDTKGYIVYGGSEVQQRSLGTILGWQSIDSFVNDLEGKLSEKHSRSD